MFLARAGQAAIPFHGCLDMNAGSTCITEFHKFLVDDPVFCYRYRTETCVGGNPGVRSSRDNVALPAWITYSMERTMRNPFST